MGRPRKSKARRPGANRRDFFRRTAGAVAVLGALPLLQACGGGDDDVTLGPSPPPPGDNVFRHGAASGDPLADRVVLWTRVTPTAAAAAVSVDYVIATDPTLSVVIGSGRIDTDATRDYTVKIDAAGLQPGTTYYYRFSAAGFDSPVGRTRTLPVGSTARLRMAVASCSSLAHGFFNAYRRIAERADLDLVVHLGDYIYEYGSGEFGDVRAYEPASETVTLADYRTRHAQYKRDLDLQEVHRQHPMIAIWDDHEIANDSYSGGAENHDEATEGTWAARVAAGLQAYHEWMPVRAADPADLRRNNRGFAIGDLVDLIMLEQRLTARSLQLTTDTGGTFGSFNQEGAFVDPARQMLGAEQEDWLSVRLRASTAQWKLVGQGVLFAQLKLVPETNAQGGGRFLNSDQWDGYQPARDRLYAVLQGDATTPAVDNVVILTGDLHSAWAADLTPDPNNGDPASGGYDAASGSGSRAVEFVATSVTSPASIDPDDTIADLVIHANPHFKYVELSKRGYMLLDIDAARVVCEWWYVDTVGAPSSAQAFGAALQVQDGSRRLTPATQTAVLADAPAPAP